MLYLMISGAIIFNLFGVKSQTNCTRISYSLDDNSVYENNVSGIYYEHYDCQREENGTYLPWFGGVDYSRCYKKNDGSTWEIFNTGCGWTIGNINCNDPYGPEPCEWDRAVLYYASYCINITDYQSSEYGLNSNILYNNFGIIINNLTSEFGNCDNFIDPTPRPTRRPTHPPTRLPTPSPTRSPTNTPTSRPTRSPTPSPTSGPTPSPSPRPPACWTNVTYEGTNTLYKNNVSGIYYEYNNCSNPENGVYFPVFNNVNYSTCYKKNDGSSWRIWNTGCGWTIGNINCVNDDDCEWDRSVLYYTGLCSNITRNGLTQVALTTNTLYNNFGDVIHGLSSEYNNCGKKTTSPPTLIYRTKRPTRAPTFN